LSQTDGSMYVGHSILKAQRVLVVSPLHPVVPKQPDSLGYLVVFSRNHAALARGHVLSGIEREAGGSTTPDPLPPELGTVGLARILNQGYSVPPRYLSEGVQVSWMPKEVYRKDCSRARCQPSLHVDGIEIERIWLDVNEYGPSTGVMDGIGRGHEGKRGRNHLIAGTDLVSKRC